MSNSENPEKKIIIDEDWKVQAQAEKEELAKKQREADAAKAVAKDDGKAETSGSAAGQGAAAQMQWPEPSLQLLVTTLATQALVALGLVPHPNSGKSEPDLAQAKHFIGSVEMLLEKTEGNRTKEETEMIEEVLHQLRMGFVAVNES